MDESALFMQWAMEMLEEEQPVAIVNDDPAGEVTFPELHGDVSHVALVFPELIMDMEAHAANSSGSSGEATDGSGSGSGGYFSSTGGPMHHQVPKSARCAPNYSGHTNVPAVMSWNFSGASVQPGSDGTLEDAAAAGKGKPYEQKPARSASAKSNDAADTGPASAAPFARYHIMAERKRREKINQRFIELSTLIPGLKKMDKATILSEATQHLKQLQEKVKALELEAAAAAGGSNSVVGTVVLVKKPCYGAAGDDHGSPSSASSGSSPTLPSEIEVRCSEKGVMMVRILCDDAKGVVVRVLSELEEGLHLSITHANVTPFTASTIIITITTKKASFHFSLILHFRDFITTPSVYL
uniref:Uncharacterized protein n=1 Tax=Avena sativa TaxID=4498 RepID=A0ACD6A3U6_AVESA